MCGDGVPSGWEQCDDLNTVSGDGCSSTCMVEPGYSCEWGGSCHPVVCGDSFQENYPDEYGYWHTESCDDGNATGGDGCSESCEVEPGHTCEWNGPCREVICGDGMQDSYSLGNGYYAYESCDDGNDEAGDGCSNSCEIEEGFICQAPGEPCREVVCGDGFQDWWLTYEEGGGFAGAAGASGSGGTAGSGSGGMAGGGGSGGYAVYHFEQCDDGNATGSDGCSAACEIEAGFICDVPGEPCREPVCGDGYIDFIPSGGTGAGGTGSGTGGMGYGGFAGGMTGSWEQCDDGNDSSDDGCDSACLYESGYTCPEPGSPCTLAECGNGVAEYPAEDCDDGNVVANDGCTDCRYDGYGGYGGMGAGGTGIGGGSTAGAGGSGAGSSGMGG